MAAFAANSLLARAALADGGMGAAEFTAVRLATGAAVLLALARVQGGTLRPIPGSWGSALCLLLYALCFSFAYLSLGAVTGALVLFASVQASMVAWGVWRGQRPSGVEAAGLAVAFAAFVALVLPGVRTPDPGGCALMVASGFAWGAYSLRGRASVAPLGETAGNFLRAALLVLPLAALGAELWQTTLSGLLLATVSGVVTSGLGYAVWYRALPGLTPIQAASVQLAVPPIAAVAASVALAEALTARLVLCGALILGGIAITIMAGKRS